MEIDRLRTTVVSPYPLGKNNIGGVQNYIISLTPELVRKGCEITLTCPSIKDKENNLADETFGISLPISMTNTSYKGGVSLNLPRAVNIMRRRDPDVVWFHDPYASPLNTMTLLMGLALSGKKDVATDALFHAYVREFTRANLGLLVAGRISGVKKFISKGIEGRAAVSPPSARLWSSVNNDDVSKYDILPNPIDTELFTPDGPIFEDWGIDGSKILLFVGRHDKRKRLCDAVDAVAILIRLGHKVRLKVTGYGDETKNVKEQVKISGLQNFVQFLGLLSKEDLAKAYRTVGKKRGLFIAPSDDGEAHNRTISEAMASGALVIATDIAGHRFSYGEEAVFGEMAKPGNPEDLAQKIKDKLDSGEEIQDLRRILGVKFVRDNLALPIIAEKVVKHHEKLLVTKRGRLSSSGDIYRI